MKTFKGSIGGKGVFQGDVYLRRVAALPDEAKPAALSQGGRVVIAHSETGHHHAIDDLGVVRYEVGDPLRCYLLLESTATADVVHHRPFDTHETYRLAGGKGAVYEVIRQREYTPAGWRRVED